MLTLMVGCELWNSGRSFFRSAIDGLSTAASVIVVVPAPPPPPPAPEQAASASIALASPIAKDLVCSRDSVKVMRQPPVLRSRIRLVSRRVMTTLSRYNIGLPNRQEEFEKTLAANYNLA